MSIEIKITNISPSSSGVSANIEMVYKQHSVKMFTITDAVASNQPNIGIVDLQKLAAKKCAKVLEKALAEVQEYSSDSED